MNKTQIIEKKLSLIDWCETLKGLSDDIWFAPFKEGSWGTADVIAHFISWDQFLLDYRVPYIIRSEQFPAIKVDVEAINADSSCYARSGITKDNLINEFVSIRKQLAAQINSIPAERFQEQLTFSNSSTTLADYFTGLIEHDQRHKQQISALIEKVRI